MAASWTSEDLEVLSDNFESKGINMLIELARIQTSFDSLHLYNLNKQKYKSSAETLDVSTRLEANKIILSHMLKAVFNSPTTSAVKQWPLVVLKLTTPHRSDATFHEGPGGDGAFDHPNAWLDGWHIAFFWGGGEWGLPNYGGSNYWLHERVETTSRYIIAPAATSNCTHGILEAKLSIKNCERFDVEKLPFHDFSKQLTTEV